MNDAIANLRYVHVPDLAAAVAALPAETRAALQRINDKVAARASLPELVDFLFEQTHALSPCDRIGLAFVEEQGERVIAHYARADYEPVLLKAGYAEGLAGSSLREVIEQGQPRIISDLEQYLRDHPNSRSTRILVQEGVRANLTCPLQVDGRSVGVLFRSSRQANIYDDRQVVLHLAVADRLSQSVEKVWQLEQLTEANRAYTEMLGFVSHELKSPVAAMITNTKLLLDGLVGELTDAQREKLQRVVAKGEYLLGLVKEYLDLARLEGGAASLNLQPDVDLVPAVIEPALDLTEPLITEKAMPVVKDWPTDRPTVTCDPQLLTVVMVNLLGNAAKYGSDGGEIRVSLSADAEQLRVRVRNEGPGFPESQRHRLFRRFSRLQTPELLQRKGTGVGLYSCWKIVNHHGGRMTATSEPGQWAEFGFDFPVAGHLGPA